jgi:hypothetical protein
MKGFIRASENLGWVRKQKRIYKVRLAGGVDHYFGAKKRIENKYVNAGERVARC